MVLQSFHKLDFNSRKSVRKLKVILKRRSLRLKQRTQRPHRLRRAHLMKLPSFSLKLTQLFIQLMKWFNPIRKLL